ncbi:MAG: hypothetical protein ACKVOB_13855 [Sphingomonas sp.]
MSDAGEVQRLIAVARAERRAGRLDTALVAQRAAARLLGATPRNADYAHALRHVVDILVEAGRPHEATAICAEVVALYKDLPDADPLDIANAIRSAAMHAVATGDRQAARLLWIEARERYSGLDDRFARLTGKADNPGVSEADEQLAALKP